MTDDNYQENKLLILGKLTASLIHEIRNPLSAIKLNLDYLKMIEKDLPEEAVESVNYCKDALQRIQYLVDNILTFSRKNVGGNRSCSLNEITENSVSIMKYHAERKNVRIQTELDDSLPDGNFNKSKLLQVFLNLMTNSIESCVNGGDILIKTYSDSPDNITWEIADSGMGINEEDKAKIFTDFYTNKEKGTGLGLSVCKMILDECDADINFESKAGEGTRFFIRFKLNLLQGSNEIQNFNYR